MNIVYIFRHAKSFVQVMFDLNILLILLLLIIPMIISIEMSCYSNASLILPSSTILYNNLTFSSCQCLMIQPNISGFQYDYNEQSCYTFGNDSSLSNLRVKINSRVCFVNRTPMVCVEHFFWIKGKKMLRKIYFTEN
jgi:hypothetical protein